MIASLPQSHHDYTFAEYLTLERDSEIKHEFDDGEILAMTGGTLLESLYYREQVLNALERQDVQVEPVTPVREPAEGAVRLAREMSRAR